MSTWHLSRAGGGLKTALIACCCLVFLSGCSPLAKRMGRTDNGASSPEFPVLDAAQQNAESLVSSLSFEPPSHHRPWRLEQAVLPYAELAQDGATIRNVRQCRWKSETEKSVHHQDWKIDWNDVTGVDFVVVPFQTMPALAHTMLSFRLADGRALVVSVEARLEQGEVYSPIAGAAKQFELMYVLGDEEDLLGLRAEVRKDDIYLYRTKATPEQAALLLKDILRRTNSIAAQPEYYDSLANNCTTNIIDHVLQLRGNDEKMLRLRDQWSSRFPGNSDRMAYDLGLIEDDMSFDQLRMNAWISGRVRQYIGEENFSVAIRQTDSRVSKQL